MNADTASFEPLLSEAILAFTGYGSVRTPRDDSDAVRALRPGDEGEQLLAIVKHLAQESEAIEADWDDAEDGNLFPVFARRFSALHPGLPDEALRALAWRWAYYRFS